MKDTESVKQYEFFQGLKAPFGCNFVVRIDGNRFTKYTAKFDHPFDDRFNQMMTEMCRFVMGYIPGVVKVHTHSDEASFYFYNNNDWMDRRVEKLTSLIASIATAKFVQLSGDIVWFDARVIVLPTFDDWDIYEKDRRLDAFRGCVNSYSYWNQRNNGIGKRTSTKKLLKLTSKERQEMLFNDFGINIAKVPEWQRVGTFLKWEEYEKEGYNPITKENVKAMRRKIITHPYI